MGKTSKPLTILVTGGIEAWPEIQALKDQGHTFVALPELRYDIILGPTCHRMSEDERPYLGLAIQEARRRRYGKVAP